MAEPLEEKLTAGIAAFRAARDRERSEANVRRILWLTVGVEPELLVTAREDVLEGLVLRLRRLVRRERVKGLSRHWSYDLNRHIALKEALDMLEASQATKADDLKSGVRTSASRT